MPLPFSIVAYKGTSLISRLIRMFTKSEYSHVSLMLDDYHCLESNYKTPTSLQHFQYKKGSYDVFVLNEELSDEQKHHISKFIIGRINLKYDWIYIISRFFNIILGTKLYSDPKRYNCDELIVEAFSSIGIDLINEGVKLSPESITNSSKLTRIKKEEI